MTRRRVAVTGLGLVSPFGGDAEDFFARLLRGESAIGCYEPEGVPHPLTMPAVRCTGFDAEAALGRPLASTMDRFSQLGAAAAFSAWCDAGLSLEEVLEQADYGICWGTAVGGTLTFERGYRDLYLANRSRVSPLSVILGMNNSAASHIAIKLGLGGVCLTYSVACASSSVAIGEAFRRIRDGAAAVMVAGGSESPLAYGVMRAWEALRVLAPGDRENAWRACRPFHRQRAGIVLGEGAGALVLEDWEHARERGARIYAELAGYGASCDHAHIVRPAAGGQVRAIAQALDDAAVDAAEVDYVNAHGTATQEGDAAEIAALRAVFGERASRLPVSSTKSMHGHLLGAAGAVEAIVTVLALRDFCIPPTAHLDSVDPACAGVWHVAGAPLTDVPLRTALSNSFAFGGSNAVLVFRGVA